MKAALVALVALLPSAALADFECYIEQQCELGACEPYTGPPILVREAGDAWEIVVGDQMWQGYVTTSIEGLGEINIVAPPQDGTSALVSIYDSGAAAITFHALNGTEPVAATGFGNCAGDGG